MPANSLVFKSWAPWRLTVSFFLFGAGLILFIMADRASDPEPWLWAGSAANFILGAGILFGAKVAAVDPNKNTLTTWSRVFFRLQVRSQSLDRFRRVVLSHETWNIGPKFRGITFPVFTLYLDAYPGRVLNLGLSDSFPEPP